MLLTYVTAWNLFNRYYSRISLIPFRSINKQKKSGEGPELERKAMAAASSLPLLLKLSSDFCGREIGVVVDEIGHPDVDLRILEGIAVPLFFARKVTN